MLVEKLSEAALLLIVKKMVEKLLASDWRSESSDSKDIFIQFSEPEISRNYTEKYVSRFLRMRTLHSAESDVFLDEVYTPLVIEKGKKNGSKLKVDESYSLPKQKSINIIGIAGQGKSTILRKIFIEEMKRGRFFPFFIELRRVDKDEGILGYLEKSLKNLGVNINSKKLTEFLNSGKVILLLDGYDEVRSDRRMDVLNEIVEIEGRFETKIISTTRPDTEICSEVDRVNFYVKKLSRNEIIDILEKLDKRNESPELKTVVLSNPLLNQILVTPILVNLFAVCYPYLDVVPNDPVDFYDKVFLTLYSRHDKIKNFCREKYSEVSSSKAQEIFNTLSYISLVGGNLEFCEESLAQDLSVSLNLNDLDVAELDNVKNDIVNITCLIQADGFDRYVFLHKSIQEFHAAKFIATLDSENKRDIYHDILSSVMLDDSFDNVISFLRNIDKKDFHTMLTEQFADEYDLKQTSESEVRKRAREIAYEITNGKELGVHVSKKGEAACYECAFVEGVIINNPISVTSLLKSGSRHDTERLESYVIDVTFGRNEEFKNPNDKMISFLNSFIKRATDVDTNGRRPKLVEHVYDLYEYLSELGYFHKFETLVFELLKDFQLEFLKPEMDRKTNIAGILAERKLLAR